MRWPSPSSAPTSPRNSSGFSAGEGVKAPLLGSGPSRERTLRASSICWAPRGVRGWARGLWSRRRPAKESKDPTGRRGLGKELLTWGSQGGLELVAHRHQGFKMPEQGLLGTGCLVEVLAPASWCCRIRMPGLAPACSRGPLPSPRTLPGLRLFPRSPPASRGLLPGTDSPWCQAAFAPALLQGTPSGRGALQGHIRAPVLPLVASHLHFFVEGDRLAHLLQQGAGFRCVWKPCCGEQHSQQQAWVSDFQAWGEAGREQRPGRRVHSPPEAACWLWQEVLEVRPPRRAFRQCDGGPGVAGKSNWEGGPALEDLFSVGERVHLAEGRHGWFDPTSVSSSVK